MFSSGGFSENQAKAMEASFKEFISRPENRHLVEKHQKREVKQAIQLQEKMAALKFRDVVLESEYDAQIAIAPFLKNKVLRRIVQTFANDERGNFEKWATNPRIINMLSEFQKLINQGKLSEDEAEEYMLRVLKDPSNEYHEEFETKTRQVARLPTEQLVEALNEHLTERRQGNQAYKAGNYKGALYHYTRAQSIVEIIQGLTPSDQREIDVNAIIVHCNIAAVHLAEKKFGAAVIACDKALSIDPGCRKALARKVKAYLGRHDMDKAKESMEELRCCEEEGALEDLRELQLIMKKMVVADKQKDQALFKNIFAS